MITLAAVYAIMGAMFVGAAVMSAIDRRWSNAAFWALLAVSFLLGDRVGDLGNGVLALALVALAVTGVLKKAQPAVVGAEARAASSDRLGNRLFLPALIIPASALIGTLLLKDSGWVDPKQVTLISLGGGVLLALAVSMAWLRPPMSAPLVEARRLLDSVGWALVLPQMLASLGAVFALAGVGDAVGTIFADYLPIDGRYAAVVAYTIGMAAFTAVMGNAFAAFPVMTAAVGLPLVVHRFDGDPAVACAIGMLSGFCGTLLTPMAANFNIVPAALLELKDRNAVIKAQAPTALIMLGVNTGLMAWLVY